MMNQYPNAAAGLKLLFWGEIVAIIGGLLSPVPVVGFVVILVGGIMGLLGLFKASADDQGYRTALMLNIVSIVLSIITNWVKSGVIGSLLSIVASLVSLGIVYFVCITTSNLLNSVNQPVVAAKGVTVWKLNLICTVAGVIITLLMFIPFVNILAGLLGVVIAIVNLVAAILYLIFLYKSYNV